MTEERTLSEQDTVASMENDGVKAEGGALAPQGEPSAEQASPEPAITDIPHPLPLAVGEAHRPVLDRLDDLNSQVSALRQAVEGVAWRQELFPSQLRQLGHKVEEVTTAIGETRVRDLLTSLLLLHDLLDQMARSVEADGDPAIHRRNYEVLLCQVLQALQLNGIEPIATDGAFDPAIHKAVKAEPTAEPDGEGRIVKVFRKGFRSSRRVLRYAEVAVLRHEEPPPAPESEAASPAGER